MGLLYNINKLNKFDIDFINEGAPEEDNNDQNTDYTNNDNDTTAANTDDNNEDYTNDDNADTNNDNDTEDNTDNENENDNNDDNNDYTNDVPDMNDDDGNAPSDDGDNGDTGNNTNDSGNNNDESEVDDIKKQEEELYSNLSPEQLDIKHKELKRNFLAMFEVINSIIDKITSANLSEENTTTIDFVSNNLNNLRNMLIDYMNDVYKTKSYTENLIIYNRYLAALNAINKILEEMDI